MAAVKFFVQALSLSIIAIVMSACFWVDHPYEEVFDLTCGLSTSAEANHQVDHFADALQKNRDASKKEMQTIQGKSIWVSFSSFGNQYQVNVSNTVDTQKIELTFYGNHHDNIFNRLKEEVERVSASEHCNLNFLKAVHGRLS